MTCPACRYPNNSIPAADPKTVIVDFGWSKWEIEYMGRVQRENLPGSRGLCELHRENYVKVVETIEAAAKPGASQT